MGIEKVNEQVLSSQFPLNWSGHWINSRWHATKISSPETSLNPNDGTCLIETEIDRETVTLAINSAERKRMPMAKLSLDDKVQILEHFSMRLKDCEQLLIKTLRVEAGKPLWEAELDVERTFSYLDQVCKNKDQLISDILAPARCSQQKGEFALLPIGVAAAYLPFSTPLTSFAVFFSASVLSGCPLILMTSPHSAVMANVLAHILESCDDQVSATANVLFGTFNAFKQVVSDSRVSAVIFTGSREHCEWIRSECATKKNRQAVLQSGGKNSMIIDESADLEAAADATLLGAFKSAGQLCSSTSRIFVAQPVLEEFCSKLINRIKQMVINRTDLDDIEQPTMGPLYARKAVDKFLRFQTMANRETETNLLWGRSLESEQTSKGFFVSPGVHVMKLFDPASSYQNNVLFTPDVAIYPFGELNTVFQQINTNDSAYAVSLFGDPEKFRPNLWQVRSPNVFFNLPTVENIHLPLAGRLSTGQHRFSGPGLLMYLTYPQASISELS